MAQLTLLISTIDQRIQKVSNVLLSEDEDIRYVVCFEYTTPENKALVPLTLLSRKDVDLVYVEGKGLSKSRNAALRNCKTPYALIADDDAVYTFNGLQQILLTFRQHPDVDIACFQVADLSGKPFRNYYSQSFRYDEKPKGSYFISLEIAIKLTPQLPSFDEHFGLGSSYLSCGEEEVFLEQSCRKGLTIQYFPIEIARTQRNTTGSKFSTDVSVRRSKGAVLYIIHSYWGAIFRCLKYSLVHWGKVPYSTFFDLLWGIHYIKSRK